LLSSLSGGLPDDIISFPTNLSPPQCDLEGLGGHGTWVSRILLADGISTAFGENNDFGASLSKAASAEPWPPENKMGPLDPKHKALPKLRRMVNQQ
jgi:hypothetical protein